MESSRANYSAKFQGFDGLEMPLKMRAALLELSVAKPCKEIYYLHAHLLQRPDASSTTVRERSSGISYEALHAICKRSSHVSYW